jgi:predicted ATP-dependent serine protease
MASYDDGVAAMDVDKKDASCAQANSESYAEDVPSPALPMAYPYKERTFYVRKCYPQYYDQIIDLLDGSMDYITVTGTPGIGKSIFYLHVFNRIRRQGEMTIVTASFNNERTLKKCLVFEPGKGPVNYKKEHG